MLPELNVLIEELAQNFSGGAGVNKVACNFGRRRSDKSPRRMFSRVEDRRGPALKSCTFSRGWGGVDEPLMFPEEGKGEGGCSEPKNKSYCSCRCMGLAICVKYLLNSKIFKQSVKGSSKG